MNLNEDQQKAVDIKEGPAVVLAGPGSGKTAVITKRTIKLIREDHIPAGNILVVTFTRAAADEMKRRLYKEAKDESEKQVTYGTFHSIFFKILRFACDLDGSAVIREKDALRFVIRMAEELGLETEGNDIASEIRSEIAKVKGNGGLKAGYVPVSCDPPIFKKIYEGYSAMLKKNRQVDFEDMTVMTEELFETRPEVLDIWREKFKYIMIDEFQDINRLQYKLIRLLALPENNLFIVGDDDQAIYGFRGSDPKIMLGFTKDYPEAGTVILKKNYRSKECIVKVSKNLIRHNHDRFLKDTEAVKGSGDPVDVRSFPTRRAECLAITELIREYRAKGALWSQIAIIYRTNALAGQMASELTAAGIPFSIKGGCQSIYSHFAVRDILSYIKLAKGDRKRETLLSVLNRPKRYIPRECLKEAEFSFESIKAAGAGKKWIAEAVEKLEYDLSFIGRGTPVSAIVYIRRGVGYEGFLEEYASKKGIRTEEFKKILDSFEEEASCFSDIDEWLAHIDKMKNELERRADMEKGETTEAVTITTMHGSKGLEYDTVFLPDVNEGVTPYQKALTKEEEEQERRMFYVAVTRAAVNLHVFSVEKINGKPTQVSRFIKEMLDF